MSGIVSFVIIVAVSVFTAWRAYQQGREDGRRAGVKQAFDDMRETLSGWHAQAVADVDRLHGVIRILEDDRDRWHRIATGQKPRERAVMSFAKSDGGKLPLALLPFDALTAVAEVLAGGAKEYGAHNWRQPCDWSRIESAMLRHYAAYQRGEDRDPKSGQLHLAHLACNALFLVAYQLGGVGTDDRRKDEP